MRRSFRSSGSTSSNRHCPRRCSSRWPPLVRSWLHCGERRRTWSRPLTAGWWFRLRTLVRFTMRWISWLRIRSSRWRSARMAGNTWSSILSARKSRIGLAICCDRRPALPEILKPVQAIAADQRTETSLSRPNPAWFAAAVIAIALTSWLPVLVGATTRTTLGWLAAAALALVVEKMTRQLIPAALVAGLFVSSALVPSGLVTEATHYMPIAVTGGALALRVGLDAWRARRLSGLTAQPVMVAVGLYLAWAAVTTLTSTDHRTSVIYLAGMVGVCALAFWAIPKMLTDRSAGEAVLATLGILGVVIAVSVYVVAVAGAVDVFGRPVGDAQRVDLTVLGAATGVFFDRSSGVYMAPLEASVGMVIGIGSLLGWCADHTGRPLLVARLAMVIMVPAILLTLDRTAWLAAIVATGAFAVLARSARLKAAMAGVLCLLFA